MTEKRKFTKEEKLLLLKEVNQNGVKATLEKHGIYPATYYSWKKKFEEMGEAGFRHGMTPAHIKEIKMLDEHLGKGLDYSEENLPLVFGRESFRANDFYNILADWELKWIKIPKQFDNTPKFDETEVVKELLERYSEEIDR